MNILVIEDDYDLAETVCEYMEMEGIICHHAMNGQIGLKLALENSFQVILLDLNLPGLDGISICKKLRENGNDTPILMLTARDRLENKIEGFRAGTDDYMVKPFALEELMVRILALSKRRSGQVKKLVCSGLEMNLATRMVIRDNIELKLSPSLWKLLETLLRASPKVVPKSELEMKLWGEDLPESNSLKVHIHNLRKVIDSKFPQALLHTVPRHGFALFNGSEH